MKTKARIIIDLDSKTIYSIEFVDKVLNSCSMTKALTDDLYIRIMRIPVSRWNFIPNLSGDPAGSPHMLVDATLDVYPKIFKFDRKHSDFKYGCILQNVYITNEISYERFHQLKTEYVKKLAKKIEKYQEEVVE